ncbi:hypothetical protein QEH56_01225 [Pelagicoccus enzymogenes]|uniref:hypothetical protein n=1 Tax=Pelagicoccus enzymogenes TaxID=2773457 RepID=UPI00280D981D|nr:hypothetical protein [Pelagicoccus enzymogenes]MDQ8196744.1 hypothetical protein [Pelagicoccus enzymogenes]
MLNLKNVTRLALWAVASSLLLVGTVDAKKKPKDDDKYIDSKGTDTIIDASRIDVQDWAQAADLLTSSLLASDVFEKTEADPDILVIGRFVNDTTTQVDTDNLIKKIRVGLNGSGKALTTTAMAHGGKVEDETAAEAAAYAAYLEGEEADIKLPTLSLTGKLLEDRVRVKKTYQSTFTFQLTLTQIKTGLAIWEDEVQITKQGKKPSVGW